VPVPKLEALIRAFEDENQPLRGHGRGVRVIGGRKRK
jgi:hypothetical protein